MLKKIEVILVFIGVLFSGVTAYFAYSIGSEQVRAAKIQYAPIFVFKKEYTKDNINDDYNAEHLIIENQGYPILTFDVTLDTVLTMKLTEYQEKTPDKIMYYPIGYYDGKSSSSGGRGRMSMFFGNKNLRLMSDLEDEIISFNHENNRKKIIIYKTNNIMKISYIDVNDERHDKYYMDEMPVTSDTYNELKSKIENVSDYSKEDLKLNKLLTVNKWFGLLGELYFEFMACFSNNYLRPEFIHWNFYYDGILIVLMWADRIMGEGMNSPVDNAI